MTNNKQQTAVDLFAERTFNLIDLMKSRYVNQEEFLDGMLKARNEAKEMEKERMIQFCKDWFISREMNIREYYEQTYGGGNK